MQVLDKGFVEVTDVLGSDTTVVNAARVSFGSRVEEIEGKDVKLLRFLARNKHYSPFRHVMVQFHIKAPEFVLRQWYKHVVGAEWSSDHPTKDHAWNEISGRYKATTEVYIPEQFREQPEDAKQGSGGPVREAVNVTATHAFRTLVDLSIGTYEDLIIQGVAKEQARMVLPLCVYSEVYWTASFQAIANFLELRRDEHAQREIRLYASEVGAELQALFPESYRAWFGDDAVREGM